MPFHIIRDNIVHLSTDAIVNAANTRLAEGGGVCGSIFDVAGSRDMARACDAIGHCDTGDAVITPGFRLKAKYVIHAVGPIWRGGHSGEEAQLFSCYEHALQLAVEHKLESIAFPLLSSGIYGYPRDQALAVATRAIGGFLLTHELDVYLVVYDRATFRISKQVFDSVTAYIDDHYVVKREMPFAQRRDACDHSALEYAAYMQTPPPAEQPRSLEDAVAHLDDSFSESVLGWIDRKGFSDVEVYKRANLDRKVFSKLRSDKAYKPSKATAIALCIALRLSPDDARDLLLRAGYALSPSSKADVIVRYYLDNGLYDVMELNETLFFFQQPCL